MTAVATSRSIAIACVALAGAARLSAQEPERVVPLRELIVSATRTETELRDVPVNVTVVSREQLRLSSARTLEDVLLQIPGVTFGRNVQAASAHPSWQAVALRGLGGTAASRTLVMVDGVPLNDPYFGWVRWSQIPVEAIERVEIVRGGGSALWGGQSLAGVIHVITRSPRAAGLTAAVEGGSLSTFRGDALAAFGSGRVSGFVGGEYLDTDGYILTREDQRGAIDVPSSEDHVALRGKVEVDASESVRLLAQGGYFDQDKINATLLRPNSTEAGFGHVGVRLGIDDRSRWAWNLYVQSQTYTNAVASEDATRDTEEPSLSQFDVPSSGVGTNLQWSGAGLGAHDVTAGVDFLRTTGEAFEDFLYVDGAFQNRRHTGGDQILAGVFAQDRIAIGERWEVQGGLRLDVWRSYGGFRRISTIDDGELSVDSSFADRTAVQLSENVGARLRMSDRVSLRGSAYTGFRVPTLNELYKPFRAAGGIVTEANADLDPERMIGAEIGVDYQLGVRWLARLTGFWARVSDAIFDATIQVVDQGQVVAPCGFVPAGGACRQRSNVGTVRTIGTEAHVEYRPGGTWLVGASYDVTPSEIVEAANRPEIEGNRSVRTPTHQGTLRLGYLDASTLEAVVTATYNGTRYEDDENEAQIDDSLLFDLRLRRRLTPRLEAFASVRNLFDTAAEVGHEIGGLVRVDAPRTFSAGLHVRLGEGLR